MPTPIWDDTDVAQIIKPTGGNPDLKLYELSEDDLALMEQFITADEAVDPNGPKSSTINALVTGVRVYHALSPSSPGTNMEGWRKFVAFMTACNVEILSGIDMRAPEVSVFGDWVMGTWDENEWRPDGRATAIGYMYSQIIGVAAESRKATGEQRDFTVLPTGDAARAYDPAVGVVRAAAPAPEKKKRGFFRR